MSSGVRGTDFEMRTNLKAKAHSQGTLFQGGKPVDEHRYQRGYTPERMAAVSAALQQSVTTKTPTRLVTKKTAIEMGQGHKVGPNADTQGVWVGGDDVTLTKHTLKDPAEQIAATKAGNKTACPECHGGGVILPKTHVGMDGKEYRTGGDNCWQCGGHGMTYDNQFGGSAKKGKGKIPLKERVDGDASSYGSTSSEAVDHENYPKEAGKTGIWDTNEILPKGHDHPFLERHGSHLIKEAIARSTVPVEHLGRIGRIAVTHDQRMKNQNAAGHALVGQIGLETNMLRPGFPAMNKKVAEGQMYQGREKAATTLIHEIGHTSGAMGGTLEHDEARADAYMLQHNRPDPRNVRKRPSVMNGAQWVYSRGPGDAYDPDAVRAPGETQAMQEERLRRAPADSARPKRAVAGRRPPKQETLF